MPVNVKVIDEDKKEHILPIDRYPDDCPYCRKRGQPTYLTGRFLVQVPHKIRLVFQCPVAECQEIFSASYANNTRPAENDVSKYEKTLSLRLTEELPVPDAVAKVSPLFRLTFNQAHVAEINGLDQIAGPGYRKALEYLIKDFLTTHVFRGNAEKEAAVRKMLLGKCIEELIDENRIKSCAKRAAWLGNDETHYTKKWEEKDIHDLKSLINMTMNWIDLVIESDAYLESMPEKK